MSQWEQAFGGTIWEVVQQHRPDGKLFELARRSPGVRILFVNKTGQLLLNREKRHELGLASDLRLPGGKVFDDITDWQNVYNDGADLTDYAKVAAAAESKEECGIIVNPTDLKLIKRDINGGKGEWDLYFFLCHSFEIDPNGPCFHGSEEDEIEGWEWFTPDQAFESAVDPINGMSESRSARYVLAYSAGRLAVDRDV